MAVIDSNTERIEIYNDKERRTSSETKRAKIEE